MPNNRIFWAVHAVGLKGDGASGAYVTVHGAQSVGITTAFNLEYIHELGQLNSYEIIETVPSVELTLDKVLDGFPLIYHLATKQSPVNTLAARAQTRCIASLPIYDESFNSASGTPVMVNEVSGIYVNQLTYTIPVQGNCMESVGFVGNHKSWTTNSSGYVAYGQVPTTMFDNTDVPFALTLADSGGIQRRENVIFDKAAKTLLPRNIPGIASDGTNPRINGDVRACHLQVITITANLNRDDLFELGHRNPYYRAVGWPIEVNTDIEIIATSGDLVMALESGTYAGNNTRNERIKVVLQDDTMIDCGSNNRLNNITYNGGDTGGGHVSVTYSYTNHNELQVTHPQDPSFPVAPTTT